jgi:saccharopine dehydrogenase (NAD+, L-lysine forming)
MKIGILREDNALADSRVPLDPAQCKAIMNNQPGIQIVVQPSPIRCYSDAEYRFANIPLQEDLSDCAVLLGIKALPASLLMPDKIYFFFSHTIKKQPHNRDLLQNLLAKNIRLIDYEVITDNHKQRLIAFGHYAGIVGAHNGLWTYGQRTGLFDMKRMRECFDYTAAQQLYGKLSLPPIKIVLTGGGRVSKGAATVLKDMDIIKVSPSDFLTKEFRIPVFTQIDCADYAARKDGAPFDLQDFFQNPFEYKSIFHPYAKVSDIMINGIYWDNNAPAFFTIEEMAQPDFKIKVIADITCDIAPMSSIPSTLRATTIEDPVFGFDPKKGQEVTPFQSSAIDMMTIANLPNELPRDASTSFGDQFIRHVVPEMIQLENSELLRRATVTKGGKLGEYFSYLRDFAETA